MRLPTEDSKFLGQGSSMPEHVRQIIESYGWDQTIIPKTQPSRHQIDYYMPTLDWLQEIHVVRDRKLVAAALVVQRGEPMKRIPWAKAKRLSENTYHRNWCLKVYDSSIETIAARLNSGKIIDTSVHRVRKYA